MIGDVIDLGLHRILTQLQIDSYDASKDNQRSNIGLFRYHYDENNVSGMFRFFYKIFNVKDDDKYAITANQVDLVRNQYRYNAMSLLKNEDKIYSLKYIEEKLNRTIDLYVDGLRVSNDDIELFISENVTIIMIPRRYIKDIDIVDITVASRTYINEYTTEVDELNQISVPKRYSGFAHNIYCDGLLVTDYTINDESDGIILRFVNDYIGKKLQVSIVKDIRMQYNIPPAVRHFKIGDVKGTIIPENMYLYSNGVLQEAEIENPYPNIFKFQDYLFGEDKVVQVFYKNKHIQSIDDPILNYSELFNLVNQLENNVVPRYVRDYNIPRVGYKMKNYRDGYSGMSLYDFQKTLFANLIRHNPYNYNRYLDLLCLADEPRVIDMSIKDYESYLRSDNLSEITEMTLQTTFEEDKVLIAFGNPVNSSFNIYVNGLITKSYLEYFEDKMTYLYFPMDDLKSTDVVEIDLYKGIADFSNTVDYTLTPDMTEHTIQLSTLSILDIKDIAAFIYDDRRKCYMDTDLVTFAISDGQIAINHDESLIGKKIRLTNTWISLNKVFANTPNDRNLNRLYMSQFNYCKKDSDFYTLYLNGRYVDNDEFDVEYPTVFNTDKMTSIRLSRISFRDSDVPIVQYHPYAKPTVEYIEKIPDSGIVYLRNLSAAFSFKYFDVYLNGRKLNSTNVSIVGEKVIALRNVSSRGPLHVVARYKMTELPYEDIYRGNVNEIITFRDDKTIQSVQDLIVLAIENVSGNRELVEQFTADEIGDIVDNPDIINKIKEVFKPEEVISDGEIEEDDPYADYLDTAIIALWYEVYFYMQQMAFRKEGVVNSNTQYSQIEFIKRFYPLIKNGRIPLNSNISNMLIKMPVNANSVNDDVIAGELYDQLYVKMQEIASSGQKMVDANSPYDPELLDIFYPLIKNGKIAINANRDILIDRASINPNE